MASETAVMFNSDALFTENEDQVLQISDAEYAEELQFQETLMASVITSQMSNNAPPSTIQASPTLNPEPMKVAKEVGESSHSKPMEVVTEAGKSSHPELMKVTKEVGESSHPEPVKVAIEAGKSSHPEPMDVATEAGQSSHCICEICVEEKEVDEMFRNEYCHHSFCTDCISKHVATKIQESIHVVTCPGLNCKGVLEPDTCRDCSAMLVNDNVEVIRESECPICRRLFCAQCYVPWHSGVECEEFQGLHENERAREDLMVRELARDKKWMRCPHCKFFVEKTEGCVHLTCRCGFQFCYACGANWSESHGRLSNSVMGIL
ncbi:hypothetical protein F0562_023177 [Nyssa sinensis]|uniref:RBR-type E3 ubiquitin transferase n=1 Tax=Nyssa sinensis TaxID=561372 RepID=A0A5J5BG14_9ASTE|nr:hypothetical protein F0562_023177 [Nyssa sinensis]